jgi:hypothetical protein
MSRKRRKNAQFQSSDRPSQTQTMHSPPGMRIVGMVSIKTIRTPQGVIVVRQGERISEKVLDEFQDDAVYREIIANAMPVK